MDDRSFPQSRKSQQIGTDQQGWWKSCSTCWRFPVCQSLSWAFYPSDQAPFFPGSNCFQQLWRTPLLAVFQPPRHMDIQNLLRELNTWRAVGQRNRGRRRSVKLVSKIDVRCVRVTVSRPGGRSWEFSVCVHVCANLSPVISLLHLQLPGRIGWLVIWPPAKHHGSHQVDPSGSSPFSTY